MQNGSFYWHTFSGSCMIWNYRKADKINTKMPAGTLVMNYLLSSAYVMDNLKVDKTVTITDSYFSAENL